MKPSAILINAARGGIVNETDLYQALKNKVIAGAGLDVFENEPPTDSALLELDNVVLTPHTAAFTFEGMNNMSVGVVEQLIAYYHGTRNKPVHTVNLAGGLGRAKGLGGFSEPVIIEGASSNKGINAADHGTSLSIDILI